MKNRQENYSGKLKGSRQTPMQRLFICRETIATNQIPRRMRPGTINRLLRLMSKRGPPDIA